MNAIDVLDLPGVADAITRRANQTGRDRQVYEQWLTSEPRPGQAWGDAVHGRLLSLNAGPLPPDAAQSLRRMATPHDSGRIAA